MRDLSIIFFTDGQDGNTEATAQKLPELQQNILKREITSRFLTIGFSQGHDAQFLNKIAQSGTEMGNFFYIDTSAADYLEKVKECLGQSMSMA